MKTRFKLSMIAFFALVTSSGFRQDDESVKDDNIRTLWKNSRLHASGGYGALTNKFTNIRGQSANLVEVYGGWYINHKFLIGIEGAAVTNDIRVPDQYSVLPGERMSYEYGQFGLMTEYTMNSNRIFHLSFQLMSGAGFTTQYVRHNNEYYNDHHDFEHDTNWLFVAEPGLKLEVNVVKWLRFCPGVSYRAAFGSDALGLTASDISGASANVTLKFGRF